MSSVSASLMRIKFAPTAKRIPERVTILLVPTRNSTCTGRPICVRKKPFIYCKLSAGMEGGCVVGVIGANEPPVAPL